MKAILNRKAVSTALASVMLLSLVVAMTAGVYVLTTQSVNAVAPVSKAAFEKGEEIASEFTATIEEGGLGTKAVTASGDYEYGDIKDLVLSIQKSASYVKNVPGYFRVILQNPTSKVVKVPELKVSMKDPERPRGRALGVHHQGHNGCRPVGRCQPDRVHSDRSGRLCHTHRGV